MCDHGAERANKCMLRGGSYVSYDMIWFIMKSNQKTGIKGVKRETKKYEGFL